MTRTEARKLINVLQRRLRLAPLMFILPAAAFVLGCAAATIGWNDAETARSLWTLAWLSAMVWLLMTFLNTRQVRMAGEANAFLSSGRLDLAEDALTSALRAFGYYRVAKLLICHNLAVVVHGQKNYQAAAELCDGLLSLHPAPSRSLGRICRMLLADCRLFLGDAAAAVKALKPLLGVSQRLPLVEQLMLLPIELRCRVACGSYEEAVRDLEGKLRRAELLDSRKAALVNALLAKSLRHLGQTPMADFLQKRAELYCGLDELKQDYPFLLD
jgi:tetratricopeptide (TPR) repeat protein